MKNSFLIWNTSQDMSNPISINMVQRTTSENEMSKVVAVLWKYYHSIIVIQINCNFKWLPCLSIRFLLSVINCFHIFALSKQVNPGSCTYFQKKKWDELWTSRENFFHDGKVLKKYIVILFNIRCLTSSFSNFFSLFLLRCIGFKYCLKRLYLTTAYFNFWVMICLFERSIRRPFS